MKRQLRAAALGDKSSRRRTTKLSLSRPAAFKGPSTDAWLPAGPGDVGRPLSCGWQGQAGSAGASQAHATKACDQPPDAAGTSESGLAGEACTDGMVGSSISGRVREEAPLPRAFTPSRGRESPDAGDVDEILCVEAAADDGNPNLAGIEEILETDAEDLRASPPPLGSQHDEGEVGESQRCPSTRLACPADVCPARIEGDLKGKEEALRSADETDAEVFCMLCGLDLSGQNLAERERHLNSCLDRSQQDGGARAGGADERHHMQGGGADGPSSQLQCAICGENMEWWSEEQRAVHVNQCCDAMLQAKFSKAKSAVSSDGSTNRACAKEQERSEEAEEFKSTESARGAGGVNAGAHEANRLAAGCVRNVLRQLGLERYADTLHNANVHDLRSLARLTEGEMRQLGLSVGARKRLLSEQTALRSRVDTVGGHVGAVSARANEFAASADNGAVDDADVARAVAVAEAAKAGRTGGAMLLKGQRLKRVGQEIRDAMPERKEAKGHRKQLLLTGSRKDGSKLAGERGDDSEGCSQVALALALSASLEGQMSEHMRRRREVARNLAEVCLCGEAEKSDVQLLLLEFMPPLFQDAGAPTGRAAGVDRNGVSLIQQSISLPHSLLSRGLSDVREDDIKGGGCQSLWKLSALGAPECEEQVGLFYNGLLGRRSLSQLESRPHVFDTYGAQPSGDKSDEDGTICGNEVGSRAADALPSEAQEVYAALPPHLESRRDLSADAQDCDSELESRAAGVESSSAVEPGHQEVLAGDEHGSPVDRVDRPGASKGGCKVGDAEERSQVYRQTSRMRDAAADTTITGGCQGPDSAQLSRLSAPRKIDDVFGTCKLSGTPYFSAPSLPAVHPQEIFPLLQQGPQQGDEDESEFFVPDSEDEDAEYPARLPAISPGVRCVMTTSEEAGLSESVAGGSARGGVEAGEAQDKGMLSQLLMHMSDSEDEGGDEVVNKDGGAAASCRPEANEETVLVKCHCTPHAAGVLEGGGAQGEGGGGGIGSFSEVLSLVHRKLRDMSPQKRAAAKSAMERALGAAVEEFAASRAQIVAKAEEELAQVRGRMQRDLEAEDVLHSARLHAAVTATLCDLRKVVLVGKGASARSANDPRRPSTLEHPEHGP